jgi:iron complex outermembrane receptor protein
MTGLAAAIASSAVQADGFAIEEIIVTAQKRAQSVQDVPIAINAFSEDTLKERGIIDTADLAAQTPSLQYGESAGATQLSIRGVGFGLFTGAGENSVAVHTDGLYIANPGAIGLLHSDFAAVEVLKGPQGTLWGRNATAGVINFITAGPAEEVSGSVTAGYGRYNQSELTLDLSVPVSDTVRTRLMVRTTQRDGFVDAPNLDDDLLGYDKVSARLSVDWDLSDTLTSQWRLFNAKQDLDGPFFDPIDDRMLDDPRNAALFTGSYATDPWKTLITEESEQEDTLSGGSVRFDYEINDSMTLASITGYVNFERDQLANDTDGTRVDWVWVDRPSSDKTLSQEFNLAGKMDSWDWLIGAYMLRQDINVEQSAAVPFLSASGSFQANLVGVPVAENTYAVLNNFHLDFNEEIESLAVFTDVTKEVNDTLRVFGGLRWMQEERQLRFTDTYTSHLWFGAEAPFVNTGQSVTITACDNLQAQQEVTEVTGRLGVQWDVSADTMTYAQLSNGFKSGGHSTSVCNDDFEPENLDALEVGLKSTLWEGRAQLNAAIFAYDYTNFQVEEVIGNGAQVNNADARILGAEMDFQVAFSEAWEVNGGLTLLDTEYRRFRNVDTINDPTFSEQNLEGNPLLRSPEWSATLGTQYTLDLTSGGVIVLRADASLSGDYQLREFDHELDQQDSYTLINASASFTSANEVWRVVIWAKNLTDEAVLYGLINGNVVGGSQGWASGTWSEPRTYGAKMEYSF